MRLRYYACKTAGVPSARGGPYYVFAQLLGGRHALRVLEGI